MKSKLREWYNIFRWLKQCSSEKYVYHVHKKTSYFKLSPPWPFWKFWLRRGKVLLPFKNICFGNFLPSQFSDTSPWVCTFPETMLHIYTVEPRFNEPLFNEVLDITNNTLRPGQNYSKMYGIEPWFNKARYNEFLYITNL